MMMYSIEIKIFDFFSNLEIVFLHPSFRLNKMVDLNVASTDCAKVKRSSLMIRVGFSFMLGN